MDLTEYVTRDRQKKNIREHLHNLTTIKLDTDKVSVTEFQEKYAKSFPGKDLSADVHQKQLCAQFVTALLTGINKTPWNNE